MVNPRVFFHMPGDTPNYLISITLFIFTTSIFSYNYRYCLPIPHAVVLLLLEERQMSFKTLIETSGLTHSELESVLKVL